MKEKTIKCQWFSFIENSESFFNTKLRLDKTQILEAIFSTWAHMGFYFFLTKGLNLIQSKLHGLISWRKEKTLKVFFLTLCIRDILIFAISA